MQWMTIIQLIAVWYAIVQMVGVAVVPLTLHVFRGLPDRGVSLAKVCGILVVGVFYWLGYSYGLLRNERGGVWIAYFTVAAVCWMFGWSEAVAWLRSLQHGGRLRAWLLVELIFAIAFVGWALVRAYDPNVEHTEQPMDLMFMNSLWASATFPPQDAWLAGYGISYYYLGYWLLTTLGRLTNTLPNVAYNLGQAVWYGYLWVGCFGVVMNLLAWRFGRGRDGSEPSVGHGNIPTVSIVGGVLAGFSVAFIGNLQVIPEWLYAQGVKLEKFAAWVDVYNFPERASQTGQWFIGYEWWWWRSSRVIEDVDLAGNHIEISPINEFPMFSYLLGDNHPHLLAMPIVLLVIALALNLLFLLAHKVEHAPNKLVRRWHEWLPFGWADGAIYLIAFGSLIFLNTWDFPPYWLLLVAVVFVGSGGDWPRAIALGGVLILGTGLIYFPYFLTAQSQAGGLLPNAFNPTRLPQFVIMFGSALPALAGVVLLGWRLASPRWSTAGAVSAFCLGVPIVFLLLTALLSSTEWGQVQLARMALPAGESSYSAMIVQRWLGAPWTLLSVGILLSVAVASLVTITQTSPRYLAEAADLVFVLLLAAIGLVLVYVPEFVFLRDNFGSRMNTVFKFYYQGWLLMGLASAYFIPVALSRIGRHLGMVEGLALASLILIAGSAIFPVAGVYAKTGGFSRPTPNLDATAYVEQSNPDVMAAVQWVQLNTTPDEIVLEGKGSSYAAHQNRISTMTGRATLLGWDGHEAQWRGEAYGTMAQGRSGAIETVYRNGSADEIRDVLEKWGISYVFVGPSETELYGITSLRLEEIGAGMDTVFARGQVRIFRRREN